MSVLDVSHGLRQMAVIGGTLRGDVPDGAAVWNHSFKGLLKKTIRKRVNFIADDRSDTIK